MPKSVHCNDSTVSLKAKIIMLKVEKKKLLYVREIETLCNISRFEKIMQEFLNKLLLLYNCIVTIHIISYNFIQ